MTPDAANPDVVQAKLRTLRDLLDDLASVGPVSESRLREDRLLRYAVERILTQLVDTAVSLNSHVAAARLHRAPQDYRSSFHDAAAAGLIPESLAASLAPSVGLRNVLVHEYATVDLAIVAGSVPRALTGYGAYVQAVARVLGH